MQGDLDKDQYGGVWYEMQRDIWTLYEFFGECCTAKYTPRDDDSGIFDVRNSLNYPFFLPFIPISVNANGSCETSGQCYISFSDTVYPGPTEDSEDYKVLETDYTSYAIVFSCEDDKVKNGQTGH